MIDYFRIFTLLGLLLTHGLIHAAAQDIESPHFRITSDGAATDALPLLMTSVDVEIIGFIANVTVTQYYKNDGDIPLEAIYVFPGATDSAVYEMEMMVGERRIIASIEEKQKARETYEAAKTEGKTTSLLEQTEHDFFQTRVGNILPGDDIQVIMRYTESLIPDRGEYSFRFPLIRQASEGSNRPSQAADGKETQTHTDIGFDLTAFIVAGMPIVDLDSPSHDVDITYNNNGSAELILREEEIFSGDRDFVINYRLTGDRIQNGLLLYQGEKENFFLMMAQPPARVQSSDIPPREYLFAVDVSGSMHGEPLDTAKDAASRLLTQLRAEDRFNVYLFSGGNEAFAKESVPASIDNIDQAFEFIDSVQSGGATQLLPVLQTINQQPETDGISRSIIVITDGAIAVGADTLDYIRENLGSSNVFSFGVDHYINHSVINGMAEAGRGQAFYINGSHDDIERKTDHFLSYVSQPVLTDIDIAYPDSFEVYDQVPVGIPDVFSERPVYVIGKWRGRPAGDMIISGYSGSRPYRANYPIHGAYTGEQNKVLRLLWARERLSQMLNNANVSHMHANKDAITQLGLEYGLLTPYTSFVAVDELIRREPGQTTETVALQRQAQAATASFSGMGFMPGAISLAMSAAVQQQPRPVTATVAELAVPPAMANDKQPSVTFILGDDEQGSTTGNHPDQQYFLAAEHYFRTLPNSESGMVVKHLRNLSEVKQWLRDHRDNKLPWGIINLVVHGSPWTGLGVPARGSLPFMSPLDLGLKAHSEGLDNTLINHTSQIRLYGCGLGAMPSLLDQLSRYFGGDDIQRPSVISPRSPIAFRARMFNDQVASAEMQALTHWWVVSHRHQPYTDDELAAAISLRYPHNKASQQTWAEQINHIRNQGTYPILVEPIRIRVPLVDGSLLNGRLRAREIVKHQPRLRRYLSEAGISPGDLRWKLEKDADGWVLTGRGWMHQIVTEPTTSSEKINNYTMVSPPRFSHH